MIELRIDRYNLVLIAEEEISVEHINSLFADGIEDSFSVPFTLPIRGNERALRHSNELAAADRTVKFPNAVLSHHGVGQHTGQVELLESNEDTASTVFAVEDFTSVLKGVKLPSLLESITIDRLQHYQQTGIDPLVNRRRYAQGGDYHFPQHFNPSLYGDANPDWYPSTQPYNYSQTYEINDLVEFTEYEPVERKYIWQCMDAAAAGQNPLTHPAKWRRTAYGIVNAWREDNNYLHHNSVEGNFYAHVPWFYLKWVLRKAMDGLGFTLTGDFMDDTRFDEVLVPNSTTIDRPNLRNDLYFFRAESTTSIAMGAGPWQQFGMSGDDDATLPNQDSSNMWDPTERLFTCPIAGTWKFLAKVTFSIQRKRNVRFYLIREDGVVKTTSLGFLYLGNNTVERYLTAVMDAGDVGMRFRVVATQYHSSTLFFPIAATDAYTYCRLSGWLEQEAPTVCTDDDFIYPHRHVPDVEVGEWLIAIADLFNLDLQPDVQGKTLRIDLKEKVATGLDRHSEDQTKRGIGPIQLDHQRKITGYRLTHDLDDLVAESISFDDTMPTSFAEGDLQPPSALGQKCLVLSSRKLLKSVFRSGIFHWRSEGYFVPDMIIGDEKDAIAVKPAMSPLHMEEYYILGRKYLMPILDEGGNSSYFQTEGDRSKMYVCEYVPGSSSDGAEINVPSARSWGFGWSDLDPARINFVWDEPSELALGLSQQCHILWCTMMVNAEPVISNLLVDPAFMLNRKWCRPFLMRSQRFLVERLPLNYSNRPGPLIATGAQMFRLR